MLRRTPLLVPFLLSAACATTTPVSTSTPSERPGDGPRADAAGAAGGSGPRHGHGNHDGKGPRTGRGDHDGGAPNHGHGNHDGKGPRTGRGDHDGKGPNHGHGNHDGKGPRTGRGDHDGGGGGHAARDGGMPHRFENADEWAKRFDAPERDAWQKPDALIAALKLPADAVVADLGAGTGYFAVRLARALPAGRVVAVDVESDMVRHVRMRAEREGLKNLTARVTPGDRADVDAGTDVVLVVDTYHHIDDRAAYFAALKGRLSSRGRVVVVDFKPDSERGPPRDHKVAADVVTKELGVAGYALVDEHDLLPDQYVLVFAPAVTRPSSTP
jgi:SAM-dependent methyltransferase